MLCSAAKVVSGKDQLRSMALILAEDKILLPPGYLKKIATHILRTRKLYGSEVYAVPKETSKIKRVARFERPRDVAVLKVEEDNPSFL